MSSVRDYSIRVQRSSDAQLIFDWCAREGWNPGVAEASAYAALDAQGLFLGVWDGQPVASVYGVALGDSLAHLGGYLVIPAARGRGFGLKLFEHALARIEKRVVACEGVVARVGDYQRYGFRTMAETFRYRYRPDGAKFTRHCDLVPQANVPFRELAALDTEVFGTERVKFLDELSRIPASKGMAAVSGSRVVGLGFLRPAFQGFKIGPLLADSVDIAVELVKTLSAGNAGAEIILDLCHANPWSETFAAELNLTKVFQTARMYRGRPPRLPWSRNFAMATMEVG